MQTQNASPNADQHLKNLVITLGFEAYHARKWSAL